MTIRKRITIGLVGIAVLAAAGILAWQVKIGKISPRADTVGNNSTYSVLGQFNVPGSGVAGLAVDQATGNIFVVDQYGSSADPNLVDRYYRVQIFDQSGKFIKEFGKGYIHQSGDIAINKNGNVYFMSYVTYCVSNCAYPQNATWGTRDRKIQVFRNDGTYLSSIALSYLPRDIAANPVTGELYVLSQSGTTINVYGANNTSVRNIPLSQNTAQKIAIDSAQQIFSLDPINKVMRKYDLAGRHLSQLASVSADNGILLNTLIIDSEDKIFVTDMPLDFTSVFDKNGTYLTRFANSAVAIAAYKSERIYSDTDINMITIYGRRNSYLTGTVKGQDSDSTNQIPIELAKVKTTVNGKTYFARTDKDGKYAIDLSEQTTLPTTPVTINVSSDDSFDPKDEQATLLLNQTVTKDVALNRQYASETVDALTDPGEMLSLNRINEGMNSSFIETASAANVWTLKARVVDIYHQEVGISGVTVVLDRSAQDLPEIVATSDTNGYVTIQTEVPENEKEFTLLSWKKDEVMLGVRDWRPGSFYRSDTLPNTDEFNIAATKVTSSSIYGKTKFRFYGRGAANWRNTSTLRKVATVVEQLKQDFRVSDPKYISVVDFSNQPAWSTLGGKNGFPIMVYLNAEEMTSSLIAASYASHETAHIIERIRFSGNKNNLVNALTAHKNTCPNTNRLDASCSFTTITERTYLDPGEPIGHPWDDKSELVASSLDIKTNFMTKGSHYWLFFDRDGFKDWMKKSDYSQDKKNANKFIMNLIEARRQQINKEKSHRTYFGNPINLSKTYLVADILAGKYP